MPLRSTIESVLSRKNLQESEALQAMQIMMDGTAPAVQVAALLVSLRMKGETPEELSGFVKGMKSRAQMVQVKREPVVDTCGTGGDGANTFNISTTVAFIAAGAGVAIAKHGNRGISSGCGSADVLEALGANLALPPEQAAEILDEVGIAFFFAPACHPAMKQVAPVRKELGLRTLFNVLGPLTNPANARRQLLGVFAPELCEKIAKTLRLLGSERAYVVHNQEGLDELGLKGENQIAVLESGEVKVQTFSAKDLGLTEKGKKELSGGDSQANALTLRSILEGKDMSARRDVCLLNAAYAIMVSGLVATPEEGLKRASESIDQGKAIEKLEAFIQATKTT